MEELAPLIALQGHDTALDELLRQAEAVDPLIRAAQQKIETLRTSLKGAKDRLNANVMRKKQLEGDADAKEKAVAKHQSELNSLKSNDAYKAMLGEIQAAKDAVKKIEDDILAVMEAIEKDDRTFKETEKKIKTDEAGMQAEVKALQDKKAGVLSQHAAKKAERDTFAKTLPPALFSQYETIRAKRDGVAIVPMVNNTCSGCHMTVTPARANEIRTGKHMVLCESCTRILYLPKPAPEAAPAANAPAAS